MGPRVSEAADPLRSDVPSSGWLFWRAPVLTVEGRVQGRVKLSSPG